MFIVVVIVLWLVLLFPDGIFPVVTSPSAVLACVTLVVLAPPTFGMLAARRALRLLESLPSDPNPGQNAYAFGLDLVKYSLVGLHGGVLLLTGWPALCENLPRALDWPGVAGTLATIPFIVSLILVWISIYPAERAIRQIALEQRLFRREPAHPVWSLREFLTFGIRHHLLIALIAIILLLVVRDSIEEHRVWLRATIRSEHAADLIIGAAQLILLIIWPALLPLVWDTRPLPPGPLRDRLMRLCGLLGVRFREILVWRSGGMITNALVAGVVGPMRYMLVTDGLLERMEDEKIEAVVGHESGHVKRMHLWYFLLFAFTSSCVVAIAYPFLRQSHVTLYTGGAVVGVLLLIQWWPIFGWIAHQFERQADVFGVRALAAGGLACHAPCPLHRPDGFASTPGRAPAEERAVTGALCPTAAHLYANMLHDVARLNGIPPDENDWQHPSISDRARMVEALAQDPRAVERFERRVTAVQRGIAVAAVVGVVGASISLKVWTIFGI